ncbi:GMC family oxidoreductase [Chromobacterium sp. ATCC 53434]|uniref:GMC family oxidoreductase n=1 Tax=Chromobacterium sp. (strain ATCC 53434 / SC 14030) TaxID=2059672 RepID=UPI000C78AC7B|nr:GMC family oxidoreductase [Chromobacterium sp. ATCC 53434]AUH51119.1 GMC family oxidoreductase [Chromobacterium sp. ATCC 53434]
MSGRIPDPLRAGLASGWKVFDGSRQVQDLDWKADVVIVGSGAGGGIAAEVLSGAGLDVLIVEEGGLYSSADFRLNEAKAYSELYQESASRQTADKGVSILQGRTVGGGTTVNWTSAFRTPPDTLRWWQESYGLATLTPEAMRPWFEKAEQRLGIAPWQGMPNPNNLVLERGCQALGLRHARISRNVRGCWNLGYCGMGCPTNAKQSMLVTSIPAALERGARLLTRVRVERLQGDQAGKRIISLRGSLLAADGLTPSGRKLTVRAGHVVLAAGAIGSPAVMLRSDLPDSADLTGKRTFLHPVAMSAALMPERIEPYNGAPQTVYSDHFMHTQSLDGPLGFKLEVPPIHPLLAGVTFPGFGSAQAELLGRLPHLHASLALLRDGFHPDSQGGEVGLRGDGSPLLDYPLNDVVWDGVRRGWLAMAELQFAAGAERVLPLHTSAEPASSWRQARAMIESLPLQPLMAKLVSAHVMGGMAMGDDPTRGVVDEWGRHWMWRNLTVVDGSVFPTSVGANPQLSIYAFAWRAATALRIRLAAG